MCLCCRVSVCVLTRQSCSILLVLGGLRAPAKAPILEYSLFEMGKGPLGARLCSASPLAFMFGTCMLLLCTTFLDSIDERRCAWASYKDEKPWFEWSIRRWGRLRQIE